MSASQPSCSLLSRSTHATFYGKLLLAGRAIERGNAPIPCLRAGYMLHSSNFLYASLRNRVGKVYLPLLAARGVCCIAAIFHTHPCASKRASKGSFYDTDRYSRTDVTAFAPSATAVTTCRSFLLLISPAAKIPARQK